MKNRKTTWKELTFLTLYGTILIVSKELFAFLPNVEPVTLLVLLAGAVFGRKGLWPVTLFVLLSILLYGFGVWNLFYLYIWYLVLGAGILLKPVQSKLPFVLVCGAFGFLFGALGFPAYLITSGWNGVWAWILAGLPFDFVHGISNLILPFFLFEPLRTFLEKAWARQTSR